MCTLYCVFICTGRASTLLWIMYFVLWIFKAYYCIKGISTIVFVLAISINSSTGEDKKEKREEYSHLSR